MPSRLSPTNSEPASANFSSRTPCLRGTSRERLAQQRAEAATPTTPPAGASDLPESEPDGRRAGAASSGLRGDAAGAGGSKRPLRDGDGADRASARDVGRRRRAAAARDSEASIMTAPADGTGRFYGNSERFTMDCPTCGSDALRKLSLIHESGLSFTTSTTQGSVLERAYSSAAALVKARR